jgi:uncharacterized protein
MLFLSTSSNFSALGISPAMPGELSINKLLRTLKPTLHPTTFVFATIPYSNSQQISALPLSDLQMTFREHEGLTIITTPEIAERHNIPYFYRSKMITLDVHSSLEAVGFMKVISAKLADEGLSSNPVSGYFHDHVFVKEEEAEGAMRALEGIARAAREQDVGGGGG